MNYLVNRAATVALLVTALGASAATGEPVSRRVSYAGINLASEAGRAMLDRRIVHAAQEVCGVADIPDLSVRRAYELCRIEAIRDARASAQVVIARAEEREAAVQTASAR